RPASLPPLERAAANSVPDHATKATIDHHQAPLSVVCPIDRRRDSSTASPTVSEIPAPAATVSLTGITVTPPVTDSVGTVRISAKVCPAGTMGMTYATAAARPDLSRTSG